MHNRNASPRDQDTAIGQNIPAFSQPVTNSLRGSESKNEILVLNGVRAVACLSVLSFHVNGLAARAGIWGPVYNIHNVAGIFTFFLESIAHSGDSGVYLFFLLSGFLLFLPYAKALLFQSPWPSLRCFYLRRIFRILPGYYVALFLIAFFFHPGYLHSSHWHDIWIFLTFCMDNKLSSQLNAPFWTLAIEFQFYLLLPVIAWLFSLLVCSGTVRRRMLTLTFCLLVMTAWGLLTRYWGLYIADTPKLDFLIPHSISIALKPYLYGGAGKYFEVFATGMLLCMAYTYMQYASSAQYWSMRMRRFSPVLLTMGLTIVLFLGLCRFYFFDIDSSHYAQHPKHYVIFTFPTIVVGHAQPLGDDAQPLAEVAAVDSQPLAVVGHSQALAYAIGYGFCLLVLLYGSAWLKRPFEGSLLGWVGSISFSFYMWHLPLLLLFTSGILVNIQQQGWGPLVQYAALWCWTLIVIIPSSAMLYHWIEQPSMRFGERLIWKFHNSDSSLQR